MAWVSRDAGNLVGRDADLAQLRTLHAGARLLTVLGPPGVGKTRLGMHLAATVGRDYPDGVWFADVAAIADPTMLPHVLCRLTEARQEPGRTALDALVDHLRTRSALLILDGCERALEVCTALARTLCDSCPHLHVIAISREPMNTSGDTIWRTPPLAVPTLTAARDEVATTDSVQLMVARARQHDARFSITRANWAPIAEMCRRLGGLPLAVELVAPHISSRSTPVLPIAELREHTNREQILRTTLRWATANEQLPHLARLLLCRLSVFAGTFDADSAKTICSDRKLPRRTIESNLDRLANASLLVREATADAKRYRMLDSVREFALEQLSDSGEEDAFRNNLLEYMVGLAERVVPEAVDPAHATVLEREIDNIRAALSWALRRGEDLSALRLALAACSLWYFRGCYAEGSEWLERALQQAADAPPPIRARAAAWLGQLLQFRGEYAAAERWLTLAAELHQVSGDAVGSAFATGMLGQLLLMRGELERAREFASQAAERLESLGHPMHVASRLQLAIVSVEVGDLTAARAIIQQCAAQRPDPSGMLGAWLRFLEGRVGAAARNLVIARQCFTQALGASRALREQTAIVAALVELGYVDLGQHEPNQAQAAFLEAVDLARQSSDRMQCARAVEGLAGTVADDRPFLAIRLISAADRLRTLLGATAWPRDRGRAQSWLAAAQAQLSQREYVAAWELGQSDGIDEAVSLVWQFPPDAQSSTPQAPAFTVRERQIVRLLARAATNEQIARQLGIRPSTARTHVEHVMAKLGLHKRTEVVLWASQHVASDEISLARA